MLVTFFKCVENTDSKCTMLKNITSCKGMNFDKLKDLLSIFNLKKNDTEIVLNIELDY